MKRLVVLCVVFSAAFGASAQQPSEWRPNIAEDNKGATWEDTSAFIVNAITNSGRNYVAKRNASPPLRSQGRHHGDSQPPPPSVIQAVYWEYDISTPARCVLVEKAFTYNDSGSSVRIEHIDLARIDPLSIRVRSGLSNWDQSPDYQLEMTGTNQANFTEDTEVIRAIHIPDGDLYPQVSPAYLAEVCGGGEAGCRTEHPRGGANFESFTDQEIAHRVARAFMHAALLCGGTKAISPF